MNEVGKCLKVKEVCEIFNMDARTVKKYYRELGGVKLGHRVYRFPEKGIQRVLEGGIEPADVEQTKPQNGVLKSARHQRKQV